MPCFIWVKANIIYEKALLPMFDAVEVYCVSRVDRITILEACVDRYSLSHSHKHTLVHLLLRYGCQSNPIIMSPLSLRDGGFCKEYLRKEMLFRKVVC